MEDVEDEFFNGYLRRNMAKIVTQVKVRELVPHLPSLTQSDRVNIEAKRESTGNYNAMQKLFSYLRYKDNWLEELIAGLNTCEHSGLASQIQEEYKSLKIPPNGHALASISPTSGETILPPLDLNTVLTSKMDEAADVASSPPLEATYGDGILPNHTGPSSVVVLSQSPTEPVAVQTNSTEDIGAATPTSHISSSAVPSPSPQVPALKPIQVANPPENKLKGSSDKAPYPRESSVGQDSAQGLHLNPVVGSPTEEGAGASLNEQDFTDGLMSPSCVGRASAVEVCSNKLVLPTTIHSVQVHMPFDSPSTFPPVPNEGAYSDDTVNMERSSSLSYHPYESVNAENVVPSNTKASPGDENVTLGDAGTVDPGEESSIALSDTEKGTSGDAENVVLNQPSGVTLSSAEKEHFSKINAAGGAPGQFEYVALCDPERVSHAYVENEALAVGGALTGDKGATGTAVEGFQLENKNTVIPDDEDGIGEADGTTPENQENVSYKKGVVFVDAESLGSENTECVLSDKLEGSTLKDPESRAERNEGNSTQHDISTFSHYPESVIHDIAGPCNTQNRAANIMEITVPNNKDSAPFIALEPTYPRYNRLPLNESRENDCDVAHQEICSPNAPSSNHNSETFFSGGAYNGVPGEGSDGAPDARGSGDQVNSERGAPAEGHSEAYCNEDNGDTESGRPQPEDNGESADRDSGDPETGDSMIPDEGKSGGPGEGDNVIPEEGESGEPEVRNLQGPRGGEIEYAGGDSDTPGDIDRGVSGEVCSFTELPENNTEGNQDSNHLEANLSLPLSNHIPKNIVPSDDESVTESTHEEVREGQYNCTHLESSVPSFALSNHSPETCRYKDVEGRIAGNIEQLHPDKAFLLKIGLSSEESLFPNADCASPNNMGSLTPGDTNSSNRDTVESHHSSNLLNINLTSPSSLNNVPDSAAYIDVKSHIHMPTKDHCSACCDSTDEQDVDKKKLCMSDDLGPQNHSMSVETEVGEKKLEASPEQLKQCSPLGNYYLPVAVAGVVAAILWQLKK